MSVTRAVRYALRRVREHHPALGAHLDHAVRTGTYLAYDPDPRSPVRWQVHRRHHEDRVDRSWPEST